MVALAVQPALQRQELCHSLRTFFSFFRNLPLPSIRARGLFSITCKKFLQPMAQLAAPSVRGRPRSVQHLFHGGPFSIVQKKKKNTCAPIFGVCFSAEQPQPWSFRRDFFKQRKKKKVSKQKQYAYSPCFGGLSV